MPIQQVVETGVEHSTGEILSYSIDTTPWGGSPLNPVVEALDAASGATVTTLLFPTNVPVVDGDNIITDKLRGMGMTASKVYNVIVGWDDADGFHWESLFTVTCPF